MFKWAIRCLCILIAWDPVILWPYTVMFYDLELLFLPSGEETEAHVTRLFLELSENKTDENREHWVKRPHFARFATSLSMFTAAWLLFSWCLSLIDSSMSFAYVLYSARIWVESLNWILIFVLHRGEGGNVWSCKVKHLHLRLSLHIPLSLGSHRALIQFSVLLFHSSFHLDLLLLSMLYIFIKTTYRSRQSSFSLITHLLSEKDITSLSSLILLLNKCLMLLLKNYCAYIYKYLFNTSSLVKAQSFSLDYHMLGWY